MLQIVEADLLKEGSFDACVEGATYVFHTASPFIASGVTDPYKQLIDPAVKGTENVFRSIIKAGTVKRVVVTSSVAAVKGPGSSPVNSNLGCYDEDDWNLTAKPNVDNTMESYQVSKTEAERAAWRLANEAGLEMATVNPSFIIGPPRTSRTDSESLKYMKAILEGREPTRGDTNMVGVVGVHT
jgi:nucleoside-diphosphate-sugar epimerase